MPVPQIASWVVTPRIAAPTPSPAAGAAQKGPWLLVQFNTWANDRRLKYEIASNFRKILPKTEEAVMRMRSSQPAVCEPGPNGEFFTRDGDIMLLSFSMKETKANAMGTTTLWCVAAEFVAVIPIGHSVYRVVDRHETADRIRPDDGLYYWRGYAGLTKPNYYAFKDLMKNHW